MKTRKAAAIIACVAMMAMGLAGCGSPKEATFTGKSGITVAATDQWKQLQSQEELKELYMDQVDAELEESVDLALKNGDKMYFTIEVLDIADDFDSMVAMADELRAQAAELGVEEVKQVIGETYTEEQSAIIQELLSEDADLELLYQQFSNNGWFDQLESTMQDYAFVGETEATILGKPSAISEYIYTNGDGAKLHFYEASIVQDGKLYTINGWCDDAVFSKNSEALKGMINSAQWPQK